ncbi:MAG: arsenate reductase (glutaredoxin) [Planctomycetota bacterium]|nr:arsenate reductase (glutaredoxin) [Planctomycetota bacterium]
MNIKIFHNPRCTKSREALKQIEKAGIEPEVVEYLEEPPKQAELDKICRILDIHPQDLMRKSDKLYSQLVADDRKLNRKEALKILVENPKLIERPIILDEDENKAVIGRSAELVKQLLP